MKNLIVPALCITGLASCTTKPATEVPSKPNILIIYIDDLGYGDIGVNGAVGVETPAIDYIAKNGVNFTDAHCTAATCTPSRYSLLTGSYAFRNNAAILPGDAPLLINPEKGTIASMLKEAGYTTGVVGKWHLGLGLGQVNWNEEVVPGPREIGFDYSFLIPATGDRVPCVFLENQKVVGLDPSDPIEVSYSERIDGYPVGTENPELLKMGADLQHSQTIVNGISRIGYMKGGASALWVDENFPMILVDKAKQYIDNAGEKPFFLYFALHDIHVPRVIHPDFVGKSSMGPRGDAIVQVDWCTGQLIDYLKEKGMAENTLVIFSSDNGPVLDDGYTDQAEELLGEHNPSAGFRGGKYSAYEAGTRMPTIVYWPGVVEPGVSNALLSQVDLYASFAKLTGQEIHAGDAPDSEDFLDAWLGRSEKGREIMLEEAFTFALRLGDWKYIHPVEKGVPDWFAAKKIESGLSKEVQLYNLKADPGEQTNLAAKYPEKVTEMQGLLDQIRNQ
jgi:arylsulfatase A-like enzyme